MPDPVIRGALSYLNRRGCVPYDVFDDSRTDLLGPRARSPLDETSRFYLEMETVTEEVEPGKAGRRFVDFELLGEIPCSCLTGADPSMDELRRCCVSDALLDATVDPAELLSRKEERALADDGDEEDDVPDEIGDPRLSDEVERLLARIFDAIPSPEDDDQPTKIPIRRPCVLRTVEKREKGRKVLKKKYDPREFGGTIAREKRGEREHRAREPEIHNKRDTIRGAAVEIVMKFAVVNGRKKKIYTITSSLRVRR